MRAARGLGPVLGRLRFKHLRLVEGLARTGNLHRTAAELNMTQPAATKILQDLEGILDVRLFDRRPRAMAPTEVGEVVVAYARRTLAETQRFLDGLESLKRGGYGALSVGAIMATAPGILPAAIAALKARRPLMTVHLVAATSDELLALLEQGKLDLVIGRLTEERQKALFAVEPLANEDLWVFVAAGHPLADRKRLSLGELGDMPWVLQPRTSPMRQLIDASFSQAGLRSLDNLVETTSIFATLHLVREAGMIAVLPSTIVAESVARGEYVRLPLELTNPLTAYGIITRREEPRSDNAAEFIGILRDLAGSRGEEIAPDACEPARG